MNVRIELWPVAADSLGIWLLSGDDALRSNPILRASEPHMTVEAMLSENGMRARAEIIHSTSWRHDDESLVLTYVAVLEPAEYVRDDWPQALPVTLSMANEVGRPPEHAPMEPPAPRYVDVLLHAIRHLRFLVDYDTITRDHMPARLINWLRPLEPALAGLYDPHKQAFEYQTPRAM
jgi:hypothetical protein